MRYICLNTAIPYARIQEYFIDQLQIPISKGSTFNFNKVAHGLLSEFSEFTKKHLVVSTRMNVDEAGININGKRHWLHCASNSIS